MTGTVFCVVPVYNRLAITRRFLSYLNEQDYPSIRTVIVNDGSTDGTGDYLARCGFPNLTVLTGNGNLWWAGAMHMGIGFTIGTDAGQDYLLMLNDDVRIEKNYVSTLVKESAALGGAVIGSPQRDEFTGKLTSCGYLIDYWRMRMLPVKAHPAGGCVDALPGRGALYPLPAVLKAGNINTGAFPHYLADLEYSARIHELGWKLAISETADVYSPPESSDSHIRSHGLAKEYLSFRSKNNLRQRLWFFSLRGPVWLRVWAVPRYVAVGGLRFLRRLLKTP